MNASAVIDFSPPDSSVRRFIDLPAGRDLDLDAERRPRLACSSASAAALGVLVGRRAVVVGRVLAAEHRARAGVLAHEPQPAAAAGEELLGELLEVLARRR